MSDLKAAVIQFCSGLDIAANLAQIEHLLDAHLNDADIVLLPECFAMLGAAQTVVASQAQEVKNWMASMACKHQCWLIGGSLPVKSAEQERCHAACFVYNPIGQAVACYHKMHLFDVDIADDKGAYRESKDFAPGTGLTVVDMESACVGLSICYDLRFPELYRALVAQGATILTVPAAFTQVTGAAHWEVLLRARAIENQCYVLAANQGGTHPDGRKTYGHSMIISPWGEVLAEAPAEGAAVITHTLDLNKLAAIRNKMPCLNHRRMNS